MTEQEYFNKTLKEITEKTHRRVLRTIEKQAKIIEYKIANGEDTSLAEVVSYLNMI